MALIQYKNKSIIVGLSDSKQIAINQSNKIYTDIADGNKPKTKYYITINKDTKLYLPAWYSLDDKKRLINELTYYFYDLFHYNLPKSQNDLTPLLVEYRLNTLTSYLLQNTFKPKSGLTITDYKNKQIKNNEYSLDTLLMISYI